jgi:nitric oxide reductase NorD protein
VNGDAPARLRRWTLLAHALAGRPFEMCWDDETSARTSASARVNARAAAVISLPADALPDVGRLAVLRQVLDRQAGGRWAMDRAQLNSRGLVGPRGPGPADAPGTDTPALLQGLASWPRPVLLRRVFLIIDRARVDAQVHARFVGARGALADARAQRRLPQCVASAPGQVSGADGTDLSTVGMLVRQALRALQALADGEDACALTRQLPAWPVAWHAAWCSRAVAGMQATADAADSLRAAIDLCAFALSDRGRGDRRGAWPVDLLQVLPAAVADGDQAGSDGPGQGNSASADAGAHDADSDVTPDGEISHPMNAVLLHEPDADVASNAAFEDRPVRPRDPPPVSAPPVPAGLAAVAAHRASGARQHWHDEWDLHLQAYRSNWTCVHERRLVGTDPGYLQALRTRHMALSRQIRRRFSRARPAWRERVHRATDGDRLDIDAAIAAWVDRLAGDGDDGRVYTAHPPARRDLAVALLLDTSGSTGFAVPDPDGPDPADLATDGEDGDDDFFHAAPRRPLAVRPPRRRVIDVARDAIALVCEGLHALGDRHAVFGFTGQGRLQVDFHVAKSFGEAWSPAAASALAAMQPGGSTRTGAAIRHALVHLAHEPARHKLLLLVTDGYPQDSDYGPDPADIAYGLHDTAHALREAQRAGVTPFCVSIDSAGHDHLRGHCPRQRYLVIDDIDDLPDRLVQVVRRLAWR